MKKNKIIYLLLIIVIIAIIILSYLLITKNKIIQKQEQTMDLQTMQVESTHAYVAIGDHDDSIKTWNKTYAYDDFIWKENGINFKTSGYTAITTSSITESTIKINLEESEVIDKDRIIAWTIRLWSTDSTSKTGIDGESATIYPFRLARGTSEYWFEYPVLHADYHPDLKLICSEYNFGIENEGKIRKHMKNTGGSIMSDGITNGGLTSNEIIKNLLYIDSYWGRAGNSTFTNTGYIDFQYSDINSNMTLEFCYDTTNPYAVRGYPVVDITIYYR